MLFAHFRVEHDPKRAQKNTPLEKHEHIRSAKDRLLSRASSWNEVEYVNETATRVYLDIYHSVCV